MDDIGDLEPATHSRAAYSVTDEDNPDSIDRIWVKRGDRRVDYLISWSGTRFPEPSCWISVDSDSLVNLGSVL